jgi:hypothetical protein
MILNKKKKPRTLGIFVRDFSHLLGPSFEDVESSLHGPNNQFLPYNKGGNRRKPTPESAQKLL